VGQGVVVISVVSPSNATNSQVLWVSSNPSIASVSPTGYVEALSEGVTKITVTTVDGGHKWNIPVIVSSPPLNRSTVVDQGNYLVSKLSNAQISTAKSVKIYFEHASVGSNTIDGLNALGARDSQFSFSSTKRTSINFDPLGATIPPSWYSEAGRFGDVSRGYPAAGQLYAQDKLAFFDVNIRGGIGDKVDVAMFKLCYLDGNVDGQELFNQVRSTMEALEAQFPKVSFVWWTMPVQNWANVNSFNYNNLVRNYCHVNNKWLLDIADLETKDASGYQFIDEEHFNWTGTRIPVINPTYTLDNGHLYGDGADKIAQAWWSLMALIAKQRSGE